MNIVRKVLDAAGLDEKSSMLRVYSIQTQTINPDLLPKHTSQSFQKKADIALGFSPSHPDVAPALRSFTQSNPDVAISQMLDTFADEVPLACGIEVKRNGGDSCEASAQLGLWCAAGLERLRTLCLDLDTEGLHQEDLPPMVGWTVVGHEWKLCISWKDRDGSVVSIAYIPILSSFDCSRIYTKHIHRVTDSDGAMAPFERKHAESLGYIGFDNIDSRCKKLDRIRVLGLAIKERLLETSSIEILSRLPSTFKACPSRNPLTIVFFVC